MAFAGINFKVNDLAISRCRYLAPRDRLNLDQRLSFAELDLGFASGAFVAGMLSAAALASSKLTCCADENSLRDIHRIWFVAVDSGPRPASAACFSESANSAN